VGVQPITPMASRFALTPTSGSNQNPIDLTADGEFNSPALHWSDLFREHVHDPPKVVHPTRDNGVITSGAINYSGDMVLPKITALNLRKHLE